MPLCHINGLQLFYEDKGSGTPIIFIHPPGMGRKVFFYQLLLANHFRIILPDLSGHGDTIGSSDSVTILGFAEEIRRLMDELKIEKANEYLRVNRLTIKDISLKTGFNNPTYFVTWYKKNTWLSPSEYRQKSIINN